ncbi:MAG: hypothetical protein P4M12_09005 [Gammaproteobacteria bacterium]|nr:hypothetical protein [Gammaproteobacteria bacterium]
MGEVTRGDYHEQWCHIKRKYDIRITKNYIVYIDLEDDIDWETTEEYDNTEEQQNLEAHNSVINDAALLEVTPSDGLQPKQILQFKRLIGEALACSFDRDYDNARKMLDVATKYVGDRNEETSRSWYLSASFIMAILFALLGSAVWLCRLKAITILGAEGMWLILASVAGTQGALLSVITRSGKLKLNCSAGMWLHHLEGGSRIWAGALSGFLVSLAVRHEIVFAPLTRGNKMTGVMLIAGFVAGYGERLASSIISKFESTHADVPSGKNKGEGKKGSIKHQTT